MSNQMGGIGVKFLLVLLYLDNLIQFNLDADWITCHITVAPGPNL